jgi:hypothetical protein
MLPRLVSAAAVRLAAAAVAAAHSVCGGLGVWPSARKASRRAKPRWRRRHFHFFLPSASSSPPAWSCP